MPNPLPKIVILSAALGLCACSPGGPGDQAEYDPPPEITAAPDHFLAMQPVTFTARIHARPNYSVIGGEHPAILQLRANPLNKDGTPAGAAVGDQQNYVAPDGSGWSTVTFAPVQVPATERDGTAAVSVSYKKWNDATQTYIPVDTKATAPVVFNYRCEPSTGEPTSEPVRAAACTYQR
jgi:hypothetical protein